MSAWVSDRIFGHPDLATADNLTLSWLWKPTLETQIQLCKGRISTGAVFGDSISAGIDFGEGLFNFALGGLSSISLLQQLKRLYSARICLPHAILAIGTNDAMYGTEDQIFVQNLRQCVDLVRAMGAERVTLIAAFLPP